jgi:hypothetical protein
MKKHRIIQNLVLGGLAVYVAALVYVASGQVTKTTATALVPVFNTGQFNQLSGTLYIKSGALFTNVLSAQGSFSSSLLVNAASANNDPMVRFTSATGLPQLVLEDLDAANAQEPFMYFQSANNGSQGRGYIGFADRSGTNLTGNADILAFKPGGLDVYSVLTSDSLVVTNGIIDQSLTASLPMFTDATKRHVSKTVANTLLALGIQSGTGTTADDGTVTNTFGTAFSGGTPKVIVQVTGGATTVLTNAISAVGTTTFILNLGSNGKTFDYIAIGTP